MHASLGIRNKGQLPRRYVHRRHSINTAAGLCNHRALLVSGAPKKTCTRNDIPLDPCLFPPPYQIGAVPCNTTAVCEDCPRSPWRPDQHEILSVSAVTEQILHWPALHSLSSRVRHVANGECSEKSEMPPILRSVPRFQCGQGFYFVVAYNTVHMERVQGKHHLYDDQDPSSLLFHASNFKRSNFKFVFSFSVAARLYMCTVYTIGQRMGQQDLTSGYQVC